jgi:DNA-binding NtrC family response regulator
LSAASPSFGKRLSQILLIDDDALQLKVREMVLRHAGLQVHVATNPQSALALLSTPTGAEIGAVITDHFLQQATGLDFVRELRAHRPELPVIVISGDSEVEDEYLGMGITFRQKPCEPEEMIALVHSVLSGRKGQ